MRAIRLGHGYDPGVLAAVDFHAAHPQHLQQLLGSRRIALGVWYPVGVRRARRAEPQLVAGDLDEISDVLLALVAGELDERLGGDQLVIHDVTQPPRTSRPRVGELDLGFVFRQAARMPLQVLDLLRDRRRHLHVGRLGEEADHVVAGRCASRSAVPPHVVRHAVAGAAFAVRFEREAHRHPDLADAADDDRVDVRVQWIDHRRQGEARALAALLVHIVENLREPLSIQQVRHRARLFLRHHVPVAVVVVTHVLVVDPRQRPAFPLAPEPLPVPVGDHLLAVGVHRWHQQHHDVFEPPLQGVDGGEAPRELHRHLRRPDFRRMDVA